MSHKLEIAADGSASFAYRESKGRAWHRLGSPVGDNLTPRQIQKVARADFTVAKFDTFANWVDADGLVHAVPTGRQALVRTDTGKVLTECGKGWNPVQNDEAFDFFAEFVSKGDMVMDTAGVLKDGQIVWALADVKDGFEILGGDKVNGYLLFSNPHKYGQTVDIKFVMERVVCNNTLAVALNEKGQPSVRVNHRRKFDADSVKKILGIGHNKTEKFKAAAEFLASKRYNKDVIDTFIGEVFGRSEKDNGLTRTGDQAVALIENQPGAEFAPGTFWNLFNVVTYMTDNVMGREDGTRLESAVFGTNAKKKLQALDLAVELANAA